MPLLRAAFTSPGAQLLQGTETQATIPALGSAPQLTLMLPHKSARREPSEQQQGQRAQSPSSQHLHYVPAFWGGGGMLRLLSSQGVTDGHTASCHERRGARCQQRDESLRAPPAVGKAAVAEAPGSFKNRGYLVIN